jgi:Uma2 family endonuclease
MPARFHERASTQTPEGRTSVSTAPLTAAEVWFEDLPEQIWPRHEIVDGHLHMSPFAGLWHQNIATRLTAALFVAAPEDLVVLGGVNILRRSTSDRLLIPDVAVVEAGPIQQSETTEAAFLQPEDVYLAVEVISPSSRRTDLHLKKDLYLHWNIGTYWVVDPVAREVHEYGLRVGAGTWLADVDLDGIWPDADRPE